MASISSPTTWHYSSVKWDQVYEENKLFPCDVSTAVSEMGKSSEDVLVPLFT